MRIEWKVKTEENNNSIARYNYTKANKSIRVYHVYPSWQVQNNVIMEINPKCQHTDKLFFINLNKQ